DHNDGNNCNGRSKKLVLRCRVRYIVSSIFNGVLTHQDVLDEPSRHAHGSDSKAPVETFPAPHGRGNQWSQEPADIDAHVEDRKATITARIVLGIQRTQNYLRGGLDAART